MGDRFVRVFGIERNFLRGTANLDRIRSMHGVALAVVMLTQPAGQDANVAKRDYRPIISTELGASQIRRIGVKCKSPFPVTEFRNKLLNIIFDALVLPGIDTMCEHVMLLFSRGSAPDLAKGLSVRNIQCAAFPAPPHPLVTS